MTYKKNCMQQTIQQEFFGIPDYNSVIDDTNGVSQEYRHLIQNPGFFWKISLVNDLGRLTQGVGTRMTTYTNTIKFIHLQGIPTRKGYLCTASSNFTAAQKVNSLCMCDCRRGCASLHMHHIYTNRKSHHNKMLNQQHTFNRKIQVHVSWHKILLL